MFYSPYNRMFRALAKARAEDRNEGFQDHSSYVQDQTRRFTKQLPNPYLSGLPTTDTLTPKDILQGAFGGLASYDPNTRQANTNDIELDNYATSVEVNQDLLNQASKCKTVSLDSLLNTFNPSDRLRCGWVYTKGTPGDQPTVSQGALGSRHGPAGFMTSPPGQWFWDLAKAKQKIDGDRCAAMTSCTDVGSDRFKGCSFSSTRGIGVPVTPQGAIKYPRVDVLSAPPSSLISDKSQCPAPPAPGSPLYEYQRSRDSCTPLPNGSLSRDCLLQQITAGGCQMDGNLYTALINQAQPDNYAAGLQQLTSYKKYQQLASVPLLENVLRDGRTTTDIALANFKGLATEAGKTAETALNYAAKDLCLKQGIMDQFDFCSELSDMSPAPFGLECLQKEFRKQGGQPAGSLYPSAQNKAGWDSLGNWAKVKSNITALSQQTKSTDIDVQKKALGNFLGIQRAPISPQIPAIPGIEVFWFNRGTNTLLGRRTNVTEPKFPTFQVSGEVEKTGLSVNVEYYSFTNVRPPNDMKIRMSAQTDDGIAIALNKKVDGNATRGQYADSVDQLYANWDQGPTTWTNKTCWTLKKGGPNYIMVFWQQTGGMSYCTINYSPCDSSNFQPFPQSWLTLTQEPDAPMLSWEGHNENSTGGFGFYERRMPTVMEIRASPQTSVVKVQNNVALQLWSNGNGYASTIKNIAMNSWRTIALTFVYNSNKTVPCTGFNARGYSDMYTDLKAAFGYDTGRLQTHWNEQGQREGRRSCGLIGSPILFQHGPIIIYIINTVIYVNYQSATISQTFPYGDLSIDGKTPYTIIINQRSDFKSRYPNRVTIAIGSSTDWKSGRVNIASPGNGTSTFTTTNNQPIYGNDDAFSMAVGDVTATHTCDASILRLRLFDYELDDNDIQREVDNSWKMGFI